MHCQPVQAFLGVLGDRLRGHSSLYSSSDTTQYGDVPRASGCWYIYFLHLADPRRACSIGANRLTSRSSVSSAAGEFANSTVNKGKVAERRRRKATGLRPAPGYGGWVASGRPACPAIPARGIPAEGELG